ncbi:MULTISPECIES: osmotically-inducible lipoprotein OsmE [unclassified Pseudomonas]|uniref:osmotically-inducible lipoprotein OsmE n=1 Tax=unclassified Pseudomonas TaxID=196821 RepID=UPI002AC991D3|nr:MULTISPECIES: osmotically-inducible lipoprotein OsmE [unclassified Pseudomonas]MEB0040989.1 osmotically-inducible lipoprotein OsmE [Pseudomonas sp. MH10]MEB0079341.1 osmotically-inducible lipoprotein OsmE [Pseudomonas sp. MH10out]MEB0093566.1 osmotically-inducible lipoprotein OsmE [Pseudomonas sp. CCI4.2]MEB0100935.1 osmotically-inducible lipoprotein OsmE [Pseudomonas sp. CCI3.2]MEB0121781.1 osmotically-inducible lipoprotein OsmE [Pseudomonas sp. CCI1.2]
MYKQTLATLSVLAVLAGCSTTTQNPVDFVTYRNEPLVKQVEKGMNEQQVLTIGGEPSSRQHRMVHPGSCNNYVLNHEGSKQTYYVAFDGNGKVDTKGFMTCDQREANERAM